MFVPDHQREFVQNPNLPSLEQPERFKSKIKPHLPAGPVGQRYVESFWHQFGAIIATAQIESKHLTAKGGEG